MRQLHFDKLQEMVGPWSVRFSNGSSSLYTIREDGFVFVSGPAGSAAGQLVRMASAEGYTHRLREPRPSSLQSMLRLEDGPRLVVRRLGPDGTAEHSWNDGVGVPI